MGSRLLPMTAAMRAAANPSKRSKVVKVTKRILSGILLSGVVALAGLALNSATAHASCYASSDGYGGMNCYYEGDSMG